MPWRGRGVLDLARARGSRASATRRSSSAASSGSVYDRCHWSSIVARSSDLRSPLACADAIASSSSVWARSHSPARIAALPSSVRSALRSASSGGSSASARSNITTAAGRSSRASARRPAVASSAPGLAGERRRASSAGTSSARYAICLLEVVAEDLVVLAEALPLASLRLEPPREALVQLGAHGLRDARVRLVADQRVTEAVGVLAGHLGARRLHESLADERHQRDPSRAADRRVTRGRRGRAARTPSRRSRPARACVARRARGCRCGRRGARGWTPGARSHRSAPHPPSSPRAARRRADCPRTSR